MKKQNYRNPYQYSDVCFTTPSATFNHRFRNVHQIHQSQSPTLEIGEATALWKKFQKMKHNLSKISALFLSSFHSLSDDFDMDSHNFDFDILRKKANVKESLHKNLEHWHHIGPNPSVIDTIENGYSRFNNFVLWNNQSALQNKDFVTHTVKKLLKSEN